MKASSVSAGSHPKRRANPFALGVLESFGYPAEGFRSKSWDEFAKPNAAKMDFVFTVGLADPKCIDDQLLDFMIAHPILINRPIIVTPKGARLCRPSETVLDILPNADIGRFVKEDGEVVAGRGH